jgi:hypothetical protein
MGTARECHEVFCNPSCTDLSTDDKLRSSRGVAGSMTTSCGNPNAVHMSSTDHGITELDKNTTHQSEGPLIPQYCMLKSHEVA